MFQANSSRKKVKLLYIGGISRCGSTILSNVLGEASGFFSAGELVHIWDRMIQEEGICGCGAHVNHCAIWGKVLDVAFGSERQVDCAKMIRLRNSHWQSRKIPLWIWLPAARQRLATKMDWFLANVAKLYSAMGSLIPEDVIIDSSKSPAYLYMLSMLEEVDLYAVHLVRDPRANAYSWLRKKEGFSQVGAWRSSISWNLRNSMLDLLGKLLGERYMRIQYEDFVGAPAKTINAISDFLGQEKRPLTFISNDEVELGTNHCVYGNPDLFRTGKIKLCVDDKWKNMTTRDRIIASTLTWPFMKRFGYDITM